MPEEKVVLKIITGAANILTFQGHCGTIIRRMVGTVSFPCNKLVRSGFHNKYPSYTNAVITNINRVSNVIQVIVQRKVEVEFKPEICFGEKRISIGSFIFTGKQ